MLQNFRALNANARHGIVALLLGAFSLAAIIWISGAAPLQLMFFGALVFGHLCYAQEAGFEKPLTKLVLVTLCFGVIGFVLYIVEGSAKAGLLFVFSGFLAIFFWALALLHRPGPARQAGKAGALAGAIALAILIAGHVFVGVGAVLGLNALRSAAIASPNDVLRLVQITCACLGFWSIACAWMIFKGYLASTDQV